MRFFFITNSPDVARFVTTRGVDRIFVDLEINGKVQRQGHLDTVISRHDIADVAHVREAIPAAELMVRLNPLHAGSSSEVDDAISAGADVIMLPMFRSSTEVRTFSQLINGRCRLCLLAETGDAAANIEECASVPGVSEVHIGLNDLSLDLKLGFMFRPFATGLIDQMAATLRSLDMPFGVGGLARADEGMLSARLLLSEHVRIGSSAAILSRTFHRQLATPAAIEAEMNFAHEVELLREIELGYLVAPAAQLEENRKLIWHRINQIDADSRRQSG